MNCPHCRTTLLMSERQGVEIDYCPDCRGVWLDRGELDKIVARSSGETFREAAPAPPPAPRSVPSWDRHRTPEKRKKKRTSFLEEIFDF